MFRRNVFVKQCTIIFFLLNKHTCSCHLLDKSRFVSKKYNFGGENPHFFFIKLIIQQLSTDFSLKKKIVSNPLFIFWKQYFACIYLALCVYLGQIRVKYLKSQLTDTSTLDAEVDFCKSSTTISTVKITQFLIVHIIAKPISNPIASSAHCNFEKRLNCFFVSSNSQYF